MAKRRATRARHHRISRRYDYPTPGELRNPCVVVETSRLPDGGYGFDLKLNKIAQPWCKVEDKGGIFVKNANEENEEVTHCFWCRKNDTWSPEKDWFIIYKERVYRIMKTKAVSDRIHFWRIYTMDEGPLDDYGYDNVDTPEDPHDTDNPQAEPAPVHDGFPLWS